LAARRWAIPVAVVVAILLAVTVYLSTRGDGESTAAESPEPAASAGSASPAGKAAAKSTDGKGGKATSDQDAGRQKGAAGASEAPSGSTGRGSTGPGSLEPVPVAPAKVNRPVALDETADFGTGLTVRLVDVEAVKGKAEGPGQIAGPALRVTLQARNESGKKVSLEGSVVDLSYGEGQTPGMRLRGPGTVEFPASVKSGGTAKGAYVFAVPEDQRYLIKVSMSYVASEPTVVFMGAAT
jgi:hypothetical protein